MLGLKNKVVLITGGAAGIGAAAARRFVDEGSVVIIWDINESAGVAFVEELVLEGKEIRFYKIDTSSYEQVNDGIGEIVKHYGTLDILINNAGITRDSSLKKMTQEQWQQVIDINLSGVFYTAQAAAAIMSEKGFGRIINVSSVVGLYGNFGQTNYAATKAGVIGMTKTIARELGKKGITVNAVAPGFIATEMVAKMPEVVLQSMKDKIPVGRLGRPEEIAATFAFLASEEAAYINGAVISVDGGVVI